MAGQELKELGGEEELTRFNLTQELAKLEQVIDQHYTAGDDLNVIFHEEVTRYTKGPPGYLEEVRENKDEKLLDSEKLREYASDFWEKRRVKPEVK